MVDYHRPVNYSTGIEDAYSYWYNESTIHVHSICPVTGRISLLSGDASANSVSLLDSDDGGRTWDKTSDVYTGSTHTSSCLMYDHEGTLHIISQLYKGADAWGAAQWMYQHTKRLTGEISWSSSVDCVSALIPAKTGGWYFFANMALNGNGDILLAYQQQVPTYTGTPPEAVTNEIRIVVYDNATDTWESSSEERISFLYTETEDSHDLTRYPATLLEDDKTAHVMINVRVNVGGAPPFPQRHRHFWAKYSGGSYTVQTSYELFEDPDIASGTEYQQGLLQVTTGEIYYVVTEEFDINNPGVSFWEWDSELEKWGTKTQIFTSDGTNYIYECLLLELPDGTLRVLGTGEGFGDTADEQATYRIVYMDKPVGGAWDSEPTLADPPNCAPGFNLEGPRPPSPMNAKSRMYGLAFLANFSVNDPPGVGGWTALYAGGLETFYYRSDDALSVNYEQEFAIDLNPFVVPYENGVQLDSFNTTELLDDIPGWATVAYKKIIFENEGTTVVKAFGLFIKDAGSIGNISVASGQVADTLVEASEYTYSSESAFIINIAATGGQGCIWLKWERPDTLSEGTNHVEFYIKVA